MRKVKIHFFLINLTFIILVIIDGFRLYAAIEQLSMSVQIALEFSYHIMLFVPVVYILIVHYKISKGGEVTDQKFVRQSRVQSPRYQDVYESPKYSMT